MTQPDMNVPMRSWFITLGTRRCMIWRHVTLSLLRAISGAFDSSRNLMMLARGFGFMSKTCSGVFPENLAF